MQSTILLPILLVVITIVASMPTSDSSEPGRDVENPIVMCKLPAYKGHCRALLLRWRYDPESGKCHEFKFGGCDGNGNNFLTYKACMTVCGGR